MQTGLPDVMASHQTVVKTLYSATNVNLMLVPEVLQCDQDSSSGNYESLYNGTNPLSRCSGDTCGQLVALEALPDSEGLTLLGNMKVSPNV